MRTSIDIKEDESICIVRLDNEISGSEQEEFMNRMRDDDVLSINRLILVFPEPFNLYESFRKEFNEYLRERSNSTDFKLAIVTKLLNVVGYEKLAKWVNGLAKRQEIFEELDPAIEWITSG